MMIDRKLISFSWLAIVTLLLAISGYQFFISSVQGQLQKELGSWQDRDLSSALYSDWQKTTVG
jgi:hypothetical protein